MPYTSIRRDYRISAEALEKILAHPEPSGYRQGVPRSKPSGTGALAAVH